MDIRQDFKISVQQPERMGDNHRKHALRGKGQPGVWGTSGSRRPLEHPRGDREEGRWTCRSGVNMESSAYRWYLKVKRTG